MHLMRVPNLQAVVASDWLRYFDRVLSDARAYKIPTPVDASCNDFCY